CPACPWVRLLVEPRSRELCIVGQVDNLRTDCQSVPPGNARPLSRLRRVWLRPQAALGSSAARNVLMFFSKLKRAPPAYWSSPVERNAKRPATSLPDAR